MARMDKALISELGDDPEMLDLIEEFVGELPKRAQAIQEALRHQDLENLRRLAHQLKGAAGGYGFMPISDVAALVEQGIRDRVQLEDLRHEVDELANLCLHARAK